MSTNYWTEESHGAGLAASETVDVRFAVRCRALPVDHAWALAEAIEQVLPWLGHSPGSGVHPLHVADSGNGWMRPHDPAAMLHPSRRTRLVLRIPRGKTAGARALCGRVLDIDGYEMTLGEMMVRELVPLGALFSRYVVTEPEDEERFLARRASLLQALAIRPRKMLCGVRHEIASGQGSTRTRGLMVADLAPVDSLRLQEEGLGPQRRLGCGLFIPHRDINEVSSGAEQAI